MRIAIIPARGGSKRIPRKNIREFAGRPMISYSIECALKSGLFKKVIVSTDDNEIAKVALSYGAEVPFLRPQELAGDHSTTHAVVAHAINWLKDSEHDISSVCCIYATAPFIRQEDVSQGLELFENGKWQYVFSATTFTFPIFRSFKQNDGGGLEMLFPEYYDTRSQDLPETMHDAGQFYWAHPQTWLDNVRIFDKHSTVVNIPRYRAQDIDTLEDWERAEIMWQVLQKAIKPS